MNFLQITFIVLLCALSQTVRGQESVVKIVKTTEDVVVRVGSHAVLNCTVSSPKGSSHYVEWFFLNATDGGRTISTSCRIVDEHNRVIGLEKYEIFCDDTNNDGTYMKYSLKVNVLSIPDNGVYQCRLRQSGERTLLDSLNVKLTVLSPPVMVPSTSDIVKDSFIGFNVSLKCFAEGVPAPNVTWGRASGKPLPIGRYDTTRINSSSVATIQTLTLYNITKEDSGTYRCSADNNIRPPQDLFARLSVEFSPTVAPVEPSIGSPTGENTQAMVWCKVTGNPRPTMYWYSLSMKDSQLFKDGRLDVDANYLSSATEIFTDEKYKVEQKIMSVGSLSTMESMFYSLTIQTVESQDMVYYICRAQNKHGQGWAAVELYRVNTLAGVASSGAGLYICSSAILLTLLSHFLYFSN